MIYRPEGRGYERAALEAAVAAGPGSYLAWNNLGWVDFQQGKQDGERQEAGGQYTKCMIPKGRDPLTSAFARSKHWVSDEGSCSAAGNRR